MFVRLIRIQPKSNSSPVPVVVVSPYGVRSCGAVNVGFSGNLAPKLRALGVVYVFYDNVSIGKTMARLIIYDHIDIEHNIAFTRLS